MEEDRISINESKKRKYSQSLNKIFEDYNIVFDDDKDLPYESKIKKLETSEKINLIEKINEDKEIIKSKKKKIEGTVQAIKTFCRIRPSDSKNEIFKLKENDDKFLTVNMDQNILKKFNGISTFTFSKIFDENSSQIDVFNDTCKNLINDLIYKKKSGLIFTYGMTNAGKTFTVIGSTSNPGILPTSLQSLYEKIETNENGINKYKVYCNFIEIYNEEIFDLLAYEQKNPKFKKKVQVKEKDKKFFVQDVSYSEIKNIEDFNSALNKGILKKAHSSNNINQNSSRSHTIFKIILKTSLLDEDDITLAIVDLAGSERATRTEAQGKELQEACKINQSLSVLGKCMEGLRYNSIFLNKKIVPFRESKLTMLFQEYFQGDNNIIMITNINPRKEDFEETMRALNYSCIAKEIKQQKAKVFVNPLKRQIKLEENPSGIINANDSEIIQEEKNNNSNIFKINNFNSTNIKNSNDFNIEELKDEIYKLKSQLEIMNNRNSNNFPNNSYNNFTNNDSLFFMGSNNENEVNPFSNNIFSSKNLQIPMNITQNLPFVLPYNLPFLNNIQNNNNINRNLEKGYNNVGYSNHEGLMGNENLIYGTEKNNENKFHNIDLNIPNVSTFNLVFINSKFNDFNMGYKKQQYQKKNFKGPLDSSNSVNNVDENLNNKKIPEKSSIYNDITIIEENEEDFIDKIKKENKKTIAPNKKKKGKGKKKGNNTNTPKEFIEK